MAKTRSMTRNEKRKRIKRCSGWSDLCIDLLFLVMMNLGAIEFLVFSKVCKTWRSLALSKRTKFMATQPPMLMRISDQLTCCFEDFEGKRFKTLLRCHYDSKNLKSRRCVGLTCGYLIFFGRKTHDFWLVNPITGHQLHFPNFHYFPPSARLAYVAKAVLVFSPSISQWVFLFLNRITCQLWFSLAGGQQAWNNCFAPHTHCLCAYKGKIFTMASSGLYEWTLDAKHNSMLSKTIILDNRSNHIMELVVAGENLYWMNLNPCGEEVVEVDLGKKEFIMREKAEATIGEYALFVKKMKGCGKVRTDTLTYPWSQLQHERYACFLDAHRTHQTRFFHGNMWYFPHDSLNVNNLLEEG